MPIKGLTTNREPSFPRIGVIRKGGEMTKTADGRTKPGADLQWFRFDSDDAAAVSDFVAAYGNEPTTINIYLPYATPEGNFQAWKEEYAAGGLIHRCDGETMSIWLQPDGKYSTAPKPCPYHTGEMQRSQKNPGCKPIGRLMVIIPELRRFAYVTVQTTSVNDVMELTDNLNAIYAMRGSLQGIPLVLCRRPRFISTPGTDGKRVRYEKWMLSVEVNPAWAQMQLQNMRQAAMLQASMLLSDSPSRPLMLTDEYGRTVDSETGEILDSEPPSIPPPDPKPDQKPDNPFNAEPPVTDAEPPADNLITDKQLRMLHALGVQIYGEDAWKTKRRQLVEAVTHGERRSSADLTKDEARRLIDGLLERQKTMQAVPTAAELAGVEPLAH